MNGAAYQPNGAPPQSSSAIAISEGQVYTPEGKAEAYPVPRALEVSEIPGIVQNYAQAARNSLAAGTGHISLQKVYANVLHLCLIYEWNV